MLGIRNGVLTLGAVLTLCEHAIEATVVVEEIGVVVPPVNHLTRGMGLILDAERVRSFTVVRGTIDVWTQRDGKWSRTLMQNGDTLRLSPIR